MFGGHTLHWRQRAAGGAVVNVDIERELEVVLDADNTEVERVFAVHRLRGLVETSRPAVVRRLIVVLNEPLLWLGSEIFAAFDNVPVDVGVDARGNLAAVDAAALPVNDGIDRYDADLGRVVPLAQAALLAPRLA